MNYNKHRSISEIITIIIKISVFLAVVQNVLCDLAPLLPYLPVYNTHLYFGLHLKKIKKEAENGGSGYEK